MNGVFLVGILRTLPVVSETAAGVKLAKAIIEVERNFRNSEGVFDTDKYQVTFWRGIAESTAELCEVGDVIAVRGRIQSNNYVSKEGNDIYAIEVIAEKISFLNTIKGG